MTEFDAWVSTLQPAPDSPPASNVGAWDRWYELLRHGPEPYSNSMTYALGAAWLRGLFVSDWGCGKGWARQLYPPGLYRGVDGSHSPFADVIADLADYHEPSEGIFMRHVIEHDLRWRRILTNALTAFTKRMTLVLFTPLVKQTHNLGWDTEPVVPNIAFALDDILDVADACHVESQHYPAGGTIIGPEHVFEFHRGT